MKKILGLAVVAAVMFGCGKSNNSFVVNGIVPETVPDGTYAVITDYETQQNTDSAVIKDHKFSIVGKINGNVLRSISCGNMISANIIIEEGTINIDMTNNGGASGTPLNDALKEYIQKETEISESFRGEYDKVMTDVSLDDEGKREKIENLMNGVTDKIKTMAQSYLEKNTNNAFGAYVLYEMLSNITAPEENYEELIKPLGENILNFKPVKMLLANFENVKKTAEGHPFVDFTIDNGNADGSKVSLSDYVGKGKYVLVDFWASWCGPCRKEVPNLKEVYEKYKGDKFDIVSVAVWDKRADTEKAIVELGTTWNQILDAQTVPTDLYGINAIPHIILFAPDGTILARNLRGEKLKNKIAEVLK